MQLDPSSNPSAASALTPDERRREPRVHCRKNIRIIRAEQLERQNAIPAEMVDCACHGISLLFEEPLDAGEHFMLKLELDRARLLIYSVRHCHPVGTRFHIGAEFTGFLAVPASVEPAAILSALLSLEG